MFFTENKNVESAEGWQVKDIGCFVSLPALRSPDEGVSWFSGMYKYSTLRVDRVNELVAWSLHLSVGDPTK